MLRKMRVVVFKLSLGVISALTFLGGVGWSSSPIILAHFGLLSIAQKRTLSHVFPLV